MLACAIARACTEVLEPRLAVDVDLPATHLAGLLVAVARLGGRIEAADEAASHASVSVALPARQADGLRRDLAALTGGEGVLSSRPAGYVRVAGSPPTRARPRPDPYDRTGYLTDLLQGRRPEPR